MKPGEEIDNQLDVLETKIELLMTHLGLEFDFADSWSDEPTGIMEAKKGEGIEPMLNWSISTSLTRKDEE